MQANEIIMGFDFGAKKIGVAVGQRVTGTATALETIKARDGVPDWRAIEKLVSEWQPSRFVVGLPLNMDGTSSDMSKLAEKFARRLHGRFHIEAETMDERLTSREAAESSGDVRSLDAEAAKLILESWLRKPD